MRLSTVTNQSQLPLFEGFVQKRSILSAVKPIRKLESDIPSSDRLSELIFQGNEKHCLMLLAPILSELSELSDQRWLTLIAPPVNLTSAWFRDVNINRERVLILQNNTDDSTVQQVTNTLQIGRSHTVVSWLTNLDKKVRKQLETAANQGETQSLNISLRS